MSHHVEAQRIKNQTIYKQGKRSIALVKSFIGCNINGYNSKQLDAEHIPEETVTKITYKPTEAFIKRGPALVPAVKIERREASA